jgi:adenylate cyclase
MGLTFAQLLLGDDEGAFETSRKAMAAMPTSVSPLRAAIVAFVALGRFDEAQRSGRLLLAINPDFRVTTFRKVQPFKEGAFVDRYMAALSAAGVPE